MSGNSPLSKFSPEFVAAIEHAYASLSGGTCIKCPTESNAASMKSRFYSYFRALEREDKGSRHQLISTQLTVRVLPDDKKVVYICRKEDTWENESIREALGLPKGWDDVRKSQILNLPEPLTNLQGSPFIPTPVEKLQEIRSKKQSDK